MFHHILPFLPSEWGRSDKTSLCARNWQSCALSRTNSPFHPRGRPHVMWPWSSETAVLLCQRPCRCKVCICTFSNIMTLLNATFSAFHSECPCASVYTHIVICVNRHTEHGVVENLWPVGANNNQPHRIPLLQRRSRYFPGIPASQQLK